MIIYLATCKVNGKKYVGATTKTLSERIYRHVYYSKKPRGNPYPIQKELAEHGPQNFEWLIIATAKSKKDLLIKEAYYISIIKPDLNLTAGGLGTKRRFHSEATKQKIRQSRLGKSPSNKGRPSPFKGIKLGPRPDHVKKTISMKTKGRIPWNLGKPCSAETKAKISKIAKDGFATGKRKWNGKDAFLGKKHTPETLKRMSEAKLGKKRNSNGQFIAKEKDGNPK